MGWVYGFIMVRPPCSVLENDRGAFPGYSDSRNKFPDVCVGGLKTDTY